MKFIPGQVLLYSSPHLKFNNILANGIRLIEGNKVIHVSLYLGNNFIIEALSDGVKIKYLSDLVNRDNGMVLYGISSLPNFMPTFDILTLFANIFINKPYGYLTDINILFQHGKCLLFPKKPWTVWFKSQNGFICSELILSILVNFNLKFPKIPALTEPDDFLSAPWVVTKC